MKKILTILLLCWCAWVSAQTYRIGDVYTAPDGSRGIVYYLHPDGSGGWVVALNDASTGCTWGASNDVPGLANQNPSYYQQLLNDTAGYANTQTLRNYQNNSTTYAAGKVDFAHGWVLPSPAQLSMLYGQLPFIASAITNAGGTALAYDWYWCSGERDASNAWRVDFGYSSYSGYFNNTTKTTSCRVRAVRSFSNTAVVYDTSLTYQWNTGSTQPYINVSPSQTTTYTVTGTTDYGCSTTAEQTIIVGTGSSQTIYDTVCQGEAYDANGFSLTASETGSTGTKVRTRTLQTAGCSSTLTLRLLVRPRNTQNIYQSACERYEWNGVTYYESGNYTQTFNNRYGCDSVVTLHLTINHGTHNVVTVDTCDSYTWHGTTYTTSGTYQYGYTNASDCPSTDTLHLTIRYSTHNVETIDICDSYTWHGMTYTTSGTYTYDYTNASDCPSTDTLYLTIAGAPEVNIIATADTICAGEVVTLQAETDAEPQFEPSVPSYPFPTVVVGDILCNDNSIVKASNWPVAGKIAKAIVFYVDNTGEHGWAVHLHDQSTGIVWGQYGTDITTLINYANSRSALTDFNGYLNTQRARAAGTSAMYPAVYMADFANGWYVPAAGQLRTLFSELLAVNASLQLVGGTQFPMGSNWWYWSSTERNQSFMWYVTNAGIVSYNLKDYTARVRVIRTF